MKKILYLLIACMLFAGCSSNKETNQNNETNQPVENETVEDKSLVVYFSCTGNTKDIALMIQEKTDSDLFEIVPVDAYSQEDLDYSDSNSRTSLEMNDSSSRPQIKNALDNFDEYSTIYLGYPIWHGQAPRILSTFVETYDLSDKTIIPFCTSGSSSIGSSAKNLEKLCKGTWKEGRRFSSNASSQEIEEFINQSRK